MKSKEIVDAIFESMREEVAQFVEQESQITSSLEYEERVLELSRQLSPPPNCAICYTHPYHKLPQFPYFYPKS